MNICSESTRKKERRERAKILSVRVWCKKTK